jgi:hypothetical protein
LIFSKTDSVSREAAPSTRCAFQSIDGEHDEVEETNDALAMLSRSAVETDSRSGPSEMAESRRLGGPTRDEVVESGLDLDSFRASVRRDASRSLLLLKERQVRRLRDSMEKALWPLSTLVRGLGTVVEGPE